MLDKREVLAVREASSMSSCWKEYLCVSRANPGTALLEVCRYEALGESPGEDEDGNEFAIPDSIDGKEVISVEDGYLVGGDLECYEDDRNTTYTKQDLGRVNALVEEWGFNLDDTIVASLRAAVE